MKKIQTIAIITGDIMNSRGANPELWMKSLKAALSEFGAEPSDWEIYRGDSFQLEVPASKALEASIFIKAAIKQIPQLDVKMAIGIGEKSYTANKISQSNGSAFVNSGECFESLKRANLAVRSIWPDFDEQINIMISLALITMDAWSSVSATMFQYMLKHPNRSQTEVANQLSMSQSNVSQGLKRSGFVEISMVLNFYKKQFSNE